MRDAIAEGRILAIKLELELDLTSMCVSAILSSEMSVRSSRRNVPHSFVRIELWIYVCILCVQMYI